MRASVKAMESIDIDPDGDVILVCGESENQYAYPPCADSELKLTST